MNQPSSQTEQLFITFSGIDGAGKSTQISLLIGALRDQGLRVELITFWDDVVALKRFRENMSHKVFKGDKGVGSPNTPIQRRDKNVRSPVMTLLRMAFYTLDVFSLRRAIKTRRTRKPGDNADVIICDRFIYDELANLRTDSAFTRFFISTMLRLVHTPDFAFALDANPEAAFARKPEYPLAFLQSNREAYLALARMANMTVIAPAPISEAHAEILRHIQQRKIRSSESDRPAPASIASDLLNRS